MKTFRDLKPWYGQDPFIIKYNGSYLYIESEDESRITIRQTSALGNLQHATPIVVWNQPTEQQVWAPELHLIDEDYYIYYTSSNGVNQTHRASVLKSNQSQNPFGPYIKLGTLTQNWSIDLTTFVHNAVRYAAWSGWEEDSPEFPQHLYIAEMFSPSELGPRVKISSPTLPWEGNINEGPQWIQSCVGQGLLFSANSSWTLDYSTGFLELFGNNPLNPEHWAKDFKPFEINCGHAQYLEVEHRLIYHTKLSPMPGWNDRAIIIGAPFDFEYFPETPGIC